MYFDLLLTRYIHTGSQTTFKPIVFNLHIHDQRRINNDWLNGHSVHCGVLGQPSI